MTFERALMTLRPQQESMFRAASDLEKALAAPERSRDWTRELRLALGGCVLAVEHHIDLLAKPGGEGEEIASREPRLLPALDRLSVRLAQLLVDLWELGRAPQPSDDLDARLRQAVDEMRDVAGMEFSLVNESLRPTAALD